MTSIRARITFTYLLLIIVALSTAGVFGMILIENSYMNTLKQALLTQAQQTSVWVAPLLKVNTAPDVKTTLKRQLDLATSSSTRQLTIFNAYPEIIYDTSNVGAGFTQNGSLNESPNEDPEVQEALQGGEGEQSRTDSVTGITHLYVAVPIYDRAERLGVCRVGVSLAPMQDELRTIFQQLIGGLVLIGMIAGALGLYFSNRVSSPIEDITRVAQRIAEGRLDERITYIRRDELGEMSESINLMASRMIEQIGDLTQEQSKVYGILANMVSGVFVVDRSSKITLLNHAAESMLYVQSESVIGKWHWQAIHSYELSTIIDHVVLKGEPIKRELSLKASRVAAIDPQERVLEVYVTPIQGNNGTIAGAVIVLHDISEFKRLAKMRSDFVANVSHELRTPITAIKGFSETLLDGALEQEDTARSFLKIIVEEADRMTRLVHDLLELSKIEHNQSIWRFEKDVNIADLIRTSVTHLAHQAEQAGVQLTLDESVNSTEPPLIELDRDRISQVLVNLISNAIHYTPRGGQVTVGSQLTETGIRVWVKDNGIGIPEKDLGRLFERFYRVDKARERRSGGTGLGLAIVKHIVEAHHGKCYVESKLGVGSIFSFELPYQHANG